MLKSIAKSVRRALNPSRLSESLDPDKGLQLAMNSLIDAAGVRYALGAEPERWRPGKPLKLILAGYVGTRNTGADVRVEEMIRQFRAIIDDDNLEMSIMTLNPELTAGYFRTVRQVTMPAVFPKFLFDECPKYHGVVACEGSMFKSKFANALSTMMAGALGMAQTESKLSVGYGAEAGAMDPSLAKFVKRNCKNSLVICRNEPSRDVLANLGVRTTGGTDTAWTFEPAPAAVGQKLLRDAGWDGEKRVVAICPINPFWWPVKPDLMKALANRLAGQHKREHYRSVYFHHSSAKADKKNKAYLDGIAQAVSAFAKEDNAFPILVGMEQLDRFACEAVNQRMDRELPMFISDTYNMYEMVSVLRNCGAMVSSRFHAIVCSMPGLVPSGGITMDERIRNLMNDRNHPDLFLEVDDDDLGEKILLMLRRLARDADEIREGIAKTIPKQLRLMGQMGIDFTDEIGRVYPDFPLRDLPRKWEYYLPELSAATTAIMERHG